MLPHAHIHRRHHKHGRIGGQQRGGSQIIRMAMNGLRHQVRRGRTDNDQICRPRQLDMPHLRLVIEVEKLGKHLLARQGRHGQRRDELGSARGEDAAAGNAAPAKLSDQLKALIGSNAAADDQQDAFVAHGSRVVFPGIVLTQKPCAPAMKFA